MEVVASLSQGRTAAAQCDLFTYKSVPVILVFEPPCIIIIGKILLLYIYIYIYNKTNMKRNILIIKQNTSGSRSG